MKVMIAGKFDPLHDGHLDHILKAGKLGMLIIVTHPDSIVVATSKSGEAVTAEDIGCAGAMTVLMKDAIMVRRRPRASANAPLGISSTLTAISRIA